MGLRDELGLKPGDAVRLALERELRRRVDAWDRPGFFYRGSADLLLQHGRFFKGRPTPEKYVSLIGEMGGCFENSIAACQQAPGLRYFQGVYDTGHSHFTPHAWCVDPDGDVVEVTIPTDIERYRHMQTLLPYLPPDRYGYWGAEVRWELAQWSLDNLGTACLMDRPPEDHQWGPGFEEATDLPLLKHPYDATRVSF